MIVTTKDHNITTSNIQDLKIIINLKLPRNIKEEAEIQIITIVATTNNITIKILIVKTIKWVVNLEEETAIVAEEAAIENKIIQI